MKPGEVHEEYIYKVDSIIQVHFGMQAQKVFFFFELVISRNVIISDR